MNKKLVKKMLKKQEQFEGIVRAAGNNGGDIIDIRNVSDGLVHIRSGHCYSTCRVSNSCTSS